MKTLWTTLCYLEKDDQYLMLHRTAKEQDMNREKWIGVGGKFEFGESPEDCLFREVKEETGYTLTSHRFRGMVTFVLGTELVEFMCLYTADGFEGEPIACREGELQWIPKKDVWGLNIWEGDRIFFRLLNEERPFFSLKLVYDEQDRLREALGTIYPLLKRLTNEHYFETYLRESTEGPPRKYYHITAAGILYRDQLEKEWLELVRRVEMFLKEQKGLSGGEYDG